MMPSQSPFVRTDVCRGAGGESDTPLLPAEGHLTAPQRLRATAGEAFDAFVNVERTAMPSLHWLQGTLGSGMMAGGLMYGALGGGTSAEEGLARAAVVVGSHWYEGGVRQLLAAAVSGGGHDGDNEAKTAAAVAISAWLGLMAGTALLGSSFRPSQYAGLALYHAAVMAASACLRHSYRLESRRADAASTDGAQSRNLAWALGCAATVACASIAAGGTFWLTSRGSSSGALAAGAASFHALIGACRAMGFMQVQSLTHRSPPGLATDAATV